MMFSYRKIISAPATSALLLVTLALGGCKSSGEVVEEPVVTPPPPPLPPTPAPSVSISASASTIDAGQNVTLTWNTTDADSCSASGAWSGPKPTGGNEAIGPLSATSEFVLSCAGVGGNSSDSVTVTVRSASGGGIAGRVDSSFIDRYGQNLVYLFQGDVTPDDTDGDSGDPLLTVEAEQDSGACTFAYDLGSVSAGDYTIAFTREGEQDRPQADDNIEFFGVQRVSVGANRETADFLPSNVIRVGPGKDYQTVAAAANAARDGDVVEIDAGIYSADVAAWYQDNLTLRGVGGYAHLRADGADSQGKAIWVIAGNNTIVENIEFSAITVPDQNGAGIRADGRDLVVCNGYFHDSDEGILGGAGYVLIEYSEFDNNGYGDGFSHNMYILDADRFTLRYSYMHHARIGHNVKSRARENHILYNRIMDEMSGNSSYAVDIPNGGLTYIIGNLLQQGPNSDNAAIVNYGTEGLLGGRTHNLYLVNNSLVDDFGGTFVQVANNTSLVRLINNLFVGSGPMVSGPTPSQTTNLVTTAPMFVDIDGFDYRLTAGSPAVDQGSDPGQGDGNELAPVYQYLHERNRERREQAGQIDIGAYEFTP